MPSTAHVAVCVLSSFTMSLLRACRVVSRVASVHRVSCCSLHVCVAIRNGTLDNVRAAGGGRTEQVMAKRALDRANESAAHDLPPTFPSADAFMAQVSRTFQRLDTSLQDMLAANSSMELISTSDPAPALEVSMGDKGSFVFTSVPDEQRLRMFTPQSGETHIYRWDAVEARWVSDADGHALEELFVRDMINTGLLSYPQL